MADPESEVDVVQRAHETDTALSTSTGSERWSVGRRTIGYGLLVAVPLLVGVLLLVQGLGGRHAATDSTLTLDNHGAAALLLAIAVVVGAARLAGRLAVVLGQPQVIGEIVMGVALGPTLLERLVPGTVEWLFPPNVIGGINALAQLGLIFFMFSTGQEAVRSNRDQAGREGVLIALTSLLVPFVAGLAVGLPLAARFAGTAGDSLTFPLFLGCALSITAFPVLARILTDLRMEGGRVGRLSLFAAAFGDALCWVLLTVILLLAQGHGMVSLWRSLLLSTGVAVVILWPVRLLLAKVLRRHVRPGTPLVLTIAVVGIAASSGITALLGIHQLIGAFLFGLAWPPDLPSESNVNRPLGVMSRLLLPCFFVGFGLSVDLGDLPFSWGTLGTLLALLAVAVVTKVLGVTLAGLLSGMDRRDSATLGLLMNARGLTELVVLGIGHDSGLVNDQMFGILTIVTLVTTLMTGPGVRRLGAAPVHDPTG